MTIEINRDKTPLRIHEVQSLSQRLPMVSKNVIGNANLSSISQSCKGCDSQAPFQLVTLVPVSPLDFIVSSVES